MLTDISQRIGVDLRLKTTHDGGKIWKARKPRGHKPPSWFNNRRVIHLVRDPRDTTTSMYFFMKFRFCCSRIYLSDISCFIRSIYGLPFAVDHLNRWTRKVHQCETYVRLAYEDLHGQIAMSTMKNICNFIGFSVDDRLLNDVINTWTLDRVRASEDPKWARRFFERELLPDESHCRRGVAQAAKLDVSDNDMDYMNAYIEEHLSDEYKFYKRRMKEKC